MPAPDGIREVLESKQVVDRHAAIEHERWAHWQRYVHDQCERRDDGALVIPADLVERWEVQISMPFAGVAEQEEDSDREQVRRYLPTVVAALAR